MPEFSSRTELTSLVDEDRQRPAPDLIELHEEVPADLQPFVQVAEMTRGDGALALRAMQKPSERQPRHGKKVEKREARPDRLIELPNVYQPRGIDGHVGDHVDKLAKVCKPDPKTSRFQPLDPIHVVLVNSRYVVVDGHHRRQAYLKAGLGRRGVPVKVHRIDPVDAQEIAGRSNSRQREPMTQAERLAYAWELVQARDHKGGWLWSKAQIADWASVGTRTVAKMRSTVRTLATQYPEIHLVTLSWWKAQRIAENGLDENDELEDPQEREVMMEHMAEQYAERMSKVLPRKLAGNPELLARTIAKFAPRNVVEIVKALSEREGVDLDEVVEMMPRDDVEDDPAEVY